MKYKKLLFLPIFLFCLFAHSEICGAEENAEADSNKAASAASGSNEADSEIVSVKLTIYRKDLVRSFVMPDLMTGEAKSKTVETGNEEFWINSEGKWISFKVNSSAVPQKVDYSGPRNFRIYRSAADPNSDNSQLVPIDSIAIPKYATEIGIMMFVRKNSIRFHPVDISPQSLTKGKIVVMNMTSVPVTLSLDGESKLLESMSNMFFDLKNADSPKAIPIIASVENKKNKWDVIFRSRISPSGDSRNLVLLYAPSEKKSLNIDILMLSF